MCKAAEFDLISKYEYVIITSIAVVFVLLNFIVGDYDCHAMMTMAATKTTNTGKKTRTDREDGDDEDADNCDDTEDEKEEEEGGGLRMLLRIRCTVCCSSCC